MDYQRAFPFYSGFPRYQDWNQMNEDQMMEDLEYLQQMYPMYAKRYQVKIFDLLNRVDFDGSMIYDQYPDKWQLEQLVNTIMQLIETEEMNREDMEILQEPMMSMEDWQTRKPWIRELVTVLLYYEILKRRKKRKSYYFF